MLQKLKSIHHPKEFAVKANIWRNMSWNLCFNNFWQIQRLLCFLLLIQNGVVETFFWFSALFRRSTVWIFEIAGTWNFIKDQWLFIYLFIVLILSVSFFYEVPLESIYNSHIIKITTISFCPVSASPCKSLKRPVQA